MLRTGIVGTNFISEWFIEAARNTDGRVDPVTVYSRSADRAAEFASAHGVPTHVSEYAALLDVVDLVYVASPTSGALRGWRRWSWSARQSRWSRR